MRMGLDFLWTGLRCDATMYTLWLLAIILLIPEAHLEVASITSCTIQNVTRGTDTAVKCHFGVNMHLVQKTFLVYHYTPKEQEKVLDCYWDSTKYICDSQGEPTVINFENDFTTAVFPLINTTRELEGDYSCGVTPVAPGSFTKCNFKLVEEHEAPFPVWIPVVCGVVGVLLLVGACALYKYREKVKKCLKCCFKEPALNKPIPATEEPFVVIYSNGNGNQPGVPCSENGDQQYDSNEVDSPTAVIVPEMQRLLVSKPYSDNGTPKSIPKTPQPSPKQPGLVRKKSGNFLDAWIRKKHVFLSDPETNWFPTQETEIDELLTQIKMVICEADIQSEDLKISFENDSAETIEHLEQLKDVADKKRAGFEKHRDDHIEKKVTSKISSQMMQGLDLNEKTEEFIVGTRDLVKSVCDLLDPTHESLSVTTTDVGALLRKVLEARCECVNREDYLRKLITADKCITPEDRKLQEKVDGLCDLKKLIIWQQIQLEKAEKDTLVRMVSQQSVEKAMTKKLGQDDPSDDEEERNTDKVSLFDYKDIRAKTANPNQLNLRTLHTDSPDGRPEDSRSSSNSPGATAGGPAQPHEESPTGELHDHSKVPAESSLDVGSGDVPDRTEFQPQPDAGETPTPKRPPYGRQMSQPVTKIVNGLPGQKIKVKGDGHCVLHAFKEALEFRGVYIKVNQLWEALIREVQEHKEEYADFLLDEQDPESDLKRYLEEKIYNNDSGDMVLAWLCNALCVTVVIYKPRGKKFTETTHPPGRAGVESTNRLDLYLDGEGPSSHYSALQLEVGASDSQL